MLNGMVKKRVAVVVASCVLLGAAGCGGDESLPADQVIQKASPAMQAATSFHFTLESSKPDKPSAGLFISKADGDVMKPDKLKGDLSATVAGIPINSKVVISGKDQYWTDPMSGQWATIPSAFNVSQFFDPSKGVTDILGSVKNLAADGRESVDGTDTYRLKGQVPTSSLKALSTEVSATSDLTTTLWIGASDFLLRKVTLQGALTSDETANTLRTISFKDYNKAITFETPVVQK